MRLGRPALLVDINAVEGLDQLSLGDDALSVGATVRQRRLEHDPLTAAVPLLGMALPWIGHRELRSRGTVCGSLAHADPAAELPAVAACLDATLDIIGPSGRRAVSARDFFTAPMTTVLAPDELLLAAHFPVARPGDGFAFAELSRRHGDYALPASRPRKPHPVRQGAASRPSRLRSLQPPRRKRRHRPPHLRPHPRSVRGSSSARPDRPHVSRSRRASRHPRRHARLDRLPPPPLHAPGRPRTGKRPPTRKGGPGAFDERRSVFAGRRTHLVRRPYLVRPRPTMPSQPKRRHAHEGQRQTGDNHRAPEDDAGRRAAGQARSHRHAPRLRARHLRHVHGPGKRPGSPSVPAVRLPARRSRGAHGRGPGPAGAAAPAAAGLRPPPRAAVRLLHARLPAQRLRPAPPPARGDRGRARRGAVRRAVPLHRLPEHSQRRRRGRPHPPRWRARPPELRPPHRLTVPPSWSRARG